MNTLKQQSCNQELITNTSKIKKQSKLSVVWMGGKLKLFQKLEITYCLLACLITNNMCTDSKAVIHLTNFAIKMHLRLHEPSCDHLFQFQEQKAKSIIGTSIG